MAGSVQPSVDGGLQAMHSTPPDPQCAVEGASQVAPGVVAEQQPEHEVASQEHTPPLHSWPEAHAALPPHVQTPAAEQPLAVMPQLVQAAPFVPHADADVGVVQVDPEQQPVAQVAELHPVQTPPEHVPGRQFEHTPPPDPQSVDELPPVHW
jgi:hypothetical protein